MNVENIRKVRDHIASLPPERFDMSAYLTTSLSGKTQVATALKDCETAACIAGWAVGLLRPRMPIGDWQGTNFFDAATELFGLTGAEADDLFLPVEQDNRTAGLLTGLSIDFAHLCQRSTRAQVQKCDTNQQMVRESIRAMEDKLAELRGLFPAPVPVGDGEDLTLTDLRIPRLQPITETIRMPNPALYRDMGGGDEAA